VSELNTRCVQSHSSMARVGFAGGRVCARVFICDA